MHSSFIAYPVPRNLNYLWTFGAILSFMLVAQIITGVILAMHYVPNATMAFASIEHIMRDVNYGWLIRYLHSNGASMFFLAVYMHIFRGMYYGSYKAPREVLWILGVIIYLLMMATAFMGYVLPWGMMSFAGATVITNLFTAIPLVGISVAHWLWGGYAVGDPTLNRFFSLHYLLPFMIVGVVVLHVWALHVAGQNNPDGVEVKNVERDTVAFTPYATIKDVFARLRVPDRLRLVRVLHPELSARRRQLQPRQSAGDARAYRAGMVSAAVLRDPARDPEQAGRRARAVRGDRAARVPALARHFAGQVRQIPADVPVLLLGVRRLLRRPRLSRLAGGLGRHDAGGAHSGARLFRLSARSCCRCSA